MKMNKKTLRMIGVVVITQANTIKELREEIEDLKHELALAQAKKEA